MPSPFPGMDPYLESPPFWAPLHAGLIAAMQRELKHRVPRRYSVWSDTHIWLHEPNGDLRTKQYEPDVTLTVPSESVEPSAALATLEAPATSKLSAKRRRGNRFLKIMEARSDRVVTVVELLSPSNKAPGEDRDAYLAKRNEYLATGTNLVEIDLLRGGRRMPLGSPAPPDADYYVLVSRAAEYPRAAIWPVSLRERLPEIAVPLKPEDGCAALALQPCFDWAYDSGPYDNEIDYAQPPASPLDEAAAAWAEALLEKGK